MAKKEKKAAAPKQQAVRETLEMRIADQPMSAIWKRQKDGTDGFSTGSKGWSAMGKIVVDGVRCQVSCNIIIIGSKPAEGTNGKKK